MKKFYKVAEHIFSIEAKDDFNLWPYMEENYSPFEVYSNDTRCIFKVLISEKDSGERGRFIFANTDERKNGFVTFSVFNRCDNGYIFEMFHPGSQKINATINMNIENAEAILCLSGNMQERWVTFNTAITLCYHVNVYKYNTLLIHSSVVAYAGNAYMFLGKSGTGKSTHSLMWQKSIEGVSLLNDDHPVVRVWDNGAVIVYGSPWSGKTRCYKNICAPLGGVIRIIRAPHNRINRLSILQAYASILPSCGGVTWNRAISDCRDLTIQKIISCVPCWNMECLPNTDAALICYKAVTTLENNNI